MRINEVVSPLKKYLATVRVSGTMAMTLIDAESSKDSGLMTTVEVNKKVKQWWFVQNNKVCVQVRYGNKIDSK